MKIGVIGGTGLIGSKLGYKLNDLGHEAIAASSSTGVDIISGEGLAEVLEGTDVVVDLANSQTCSLWGGRRPWKKPLPCLYSGQTSPLI